MTRTLKIIVAMVACLGFAAAFNTYMVALGRTSAISPRIDAIGCIYAALLLALAFIVAVTSRSRKCVMRLENQQRQFERITAARRYLDAATAHRAHLEYLFTRTKETASALSRQCSEAAAAGYFEEEADFLARLKVQLHSCWKLQCAYQRSQLLVEDAQETLELALALMETDEPY